MVLVVINVSRLFIVGLVFFLSTANSAIKIYDSTNEEQLAQIQKDQVCFAIENGHFSGKRLIIGKTVITGKGSKLCELEPELNEERPQRDKEFYCISFDDKKDFNDLFQKSFRPVKASTGDYTEFSLVAFVSADTMDEIKERWSVENTSYSLCLKQGDTDFIKAYTEARQDDEDCVLNMPLVYSKGRKRTLTDSDGEEGDESVSKFDSDPHESRMIEVNKEWVKLVRQIPGTWVVDENGSEVTGERMRTKPEKIKIGFIKTEKPASTEKMRENFLTLFAKAYLKNREIKCGAFDKGDRAALKGVRVIKKVEHGNEAWRVDES